jgi:hypothetical protein
MRSRGRGRCWPRAAWSGTPRPSHPRKPGQGRRYVPGGWGAEHRGEAGQPLADPNRGVVGDVQRSRGLALQRREDGGRGVGGVVALSRGSAWARTSVGTALEARAFRAAGMETELVRMPMRSWCWRAERLPRLPLSGVKNWISGHSEIKPYTAMADMQITRHVR